MGLGTTIKSVIGTVAPTLATALGGPFAGVAVKFVADKLGVENTGKVEDFLASATQDPEALAKLRQIEKEFQVKMKELDIKEQDLYVQDRDSARELAKERGLLVQGVLSGAYTVGYFATLWTFMIGEVSVGTEHVGLVQTLVGALGAVQVQILNFWFGSSRGSKDKTDALARLGAKS